jgi:hypothetical protein
VVPQHHFARLFYFTPERFTKYTHTAQRKTKEKTMPAFGAEVADDLDTQDGGGVAVEETAGAPEGAGTEGEGGDIQDRMAEPLEETPWYSPSTGAVVDKDGNPYINPKTDKPFTSMAEYEAAVAASGQSNSTAKPKNETQKPAPQAAPMSKSFEHYIAENGKIDAKVLGEMAKIEAAYKYGHELVPSIKPPVPNQQPAPKPITPMQRVEATRKTLQTHLITPLNNIRDALIKQGADPNAAAAFLQPFIAQHQQMIEEEYRQGLVNALKEEADNKVAPVLTADQEAKLKSASEGNVTKLATAYFPKGGVDAFMTLLNGYNTTDAQGKQTFVRGPAAPILDLLVNVGNAGKTFASNAEVQQAYKDMFLKITANPATARVLFDLTHNYYKGKNVSVVYETGKQKGVQQAKQVGKFIRKQPQQGGIPQGEEEDASMPKMLKAALTRGHFHS